LLFLFAIVIGTTILGVAWAALNPGRQPQSLQRTVLSVLTEAVQQAPSYSVEREFTGRIEAARQSALGFELAGLVSQVMVDEGERVVQGQLLARLDDARLRARRDELEASQAEARARLALARSTYARIKDLVTHKHASEQELDEVRENRQALESAVQLARARVASIDVDLGKTALRAPFAAVVTHRLADEGQVLPSGGPLLELLEVATPEARIGVGGNAADALAVGQSHSVTVNGRSVNAEIKNILPARDERTRTLDVILTLHTEPLSVRSGDLVRLAVSRMVRQAGFWIPLAALTEGHRGTWSVYVVCADAGELEAVGGDALHHIERRYVKILHEETDRVFAQGALKVGERIVTNGLHRIVPGQVVSLSGPRPIQLAIGEKRP
jgi:RND family efflux transporter MFP subunit